jgi:hypothetical protein
MFKWTSAGKTSSPSIIDLTLIEPTSIDEIHDLKLLIKYTIS